MNPNPPRRRAIRGAAVGSTAFLALACIMHATACKDDGTHVYLGQLYVEGRGCLGTPSAVDVISGDDPGTCQPLCIVQRRGDGGQAVYVATMCPPYPASVEFDVTGADPTCPKALAALARGDTCLIDGGSTHPAPPPPASDAAPDATSD